MAETGINSGARRVRVGSESTGSSVADIDDRRLGTDQPYTVLIHLKAEDISPIRPHISVIPSAYSVSPMIPGDAPGMSPDNHRHIPAEGQNAACQNSGGNNRAENISRA